MNIVINAILYHDKPRGVGTYLNNLIQELSEIDNTNTYYIYYGEWMKEYSFLKINKKNFIFVKAPISRGKILRNLFQLLIFPVHCLRYKPDVIHIPDTSPLIFKFRKTISTIHDLAEFVYPEKYNKFQAISRKIIVRFQMFISDKIITVSEYSKKSIIELLRIKSEKINVIPNGVDLQKFSSVNELGALFKYKLNKHKFFLYVGELEKTKNVSLALEAFNLFIENIDCDFKFVLCGKKGNDYSSIQKYIDKFNLKDKVIFTGYVEQEELLQLYSNSFSFVFPSLYEGFGLPVLEAMACSAPVICSNQTSIPEVGGESVLTFNPYGCDDLYECFKKLYEDSELRDRMVEGGKKRVKSYSWHNSANSTLRLYESLK